MSTTPTASSTAPSSWALNRTHLQLIAYTTMAIDHIGAIFFPDQPLWRIIGRLAFPLFAFFIAQGVVYTRNQRRYLLTLLGAGVIAEPAFDLALYGDIFYTPRQSVIPTLLLGALVLVIMRRLPAHLPQLGQLAASLGITFVATMIADLISSDYGGLGVLTVVAFSWIDRARGWTFVLPAIPLVLVAMASGPALTLATLAPLALIYFYDPHAPFRGLPKWLTYGFYPAHLALLAVATMVFVWFSYGV